MLTAVSTTSAEPRPRSSAHRLTNLGSLFPHRRTKPALAAKSSQRPPERSHEADILIALTSLPAWCAPVVIWRFGAASNRSGSRRAPSSSGYDADRRPDPTLIDSRFRLSKSAIIFRLSGQYRRAARQTLTSGLPRLVAVSLAMRLANCPCSGYIRTRRGEARLSI